MDTDMAHVHGHHYNPDFVEAGSADQVPPEVPEKTSVFKRMKAKAKKVKASIGHKMHGTNSGDAAGQVHDHDDEESDDEEEVAEPVYDSERSRNFAIGQEGKPTGPLSSDADQNVCPGTFQTKVTDPDLDVNPPTATPPQFGADPDASLGQPKPKVSLGEDYPSVPQHQLQEVIPPTDQSEITAEAKQVGSEDPISSSFAKMGIHDDQQRETETPSLKSGGHDEFCDQVESSPIPDFLSDKANVIPEHTESVAPVPETYSPRSPSRTKDMDVDISYPKDVNVDAHHPQGMDVDTVETPAETTNQGGYLSSAASAFTGAKNAVASKIGYGGSEEKSSDVPVTSTDDAVTDRSPVETVETPQPQPGYVASAASAAVSAKNAVASKLGYGGSADTASVESDTSGAPVDSTEDVVTDKSPVETKNAVASKLGYGGSTDDTAAVESDTSGAPVDSTEDVITDRSPLETPQPRGGYVATATSVLAGTAASVKDTVASKLGYGGTDNATTKTTRDLDDTSAVTEPETETDKGVSVKGYISEKLAPGEDDKALSDYISSALHKSPKGVETVEVEEEKPSVGEKVADAFHKRNDTEEDVDPSIPMGRVTESDQVASRLGSSESERTGLASPGAESPSTGMVGKFKGAISNWFGKSEEIDTSPHSPIQGTTEEHLPKLGEEEAVKK